MDKQKRKAITKKTRFELFKRDEFTCQYCGGTPPKSVLEVDHINPIFNGGDNNIDNLITSCFDCNRGKGSKLLSSVPETIKQKALRIAEQEEQIKEYNRMISNKRRRENRDIDKIEIVFKETYKDYAFLPSFKESIRINFLPYIPLDVIISSMSKAVSITRNQDGATKYFCGICWNIRKRNEK